MIHIDTCIENNSGEHVETICFTTALNPYKLLTFNAAMEQFLERTKIKYVRYDPASNSIVIQYNGVVQSVVMGVGYRLIKSASDRLLMAKPSAFEKYYTIVSTETADSCKKMDDILSGSLLNALRSTSRIVDEVVTDTKHQARYSYSYLMDNGITTNSEATDSIDVYTIITDMRQNPHILMANIVDSLSHMKYYKVNFHPDCVNDAALRIRSALYELIVPKVGQNCGVIDMFYDKCHGGDNRRMVVLDASTRYVLDDTTWLCVSENSTEPLYTISDHTINITFNAHIVNDNSNKFVTMDHLIRIGAMDKLSELLSNYGFKVDLPTPGDNTTIRICRKYNPQ